MAETHVASAARMSSGKIVFDPERHAEFSIAALETYAFARREALVIDALTVVAAVEYMDRTVSRSGLSWARHLELEIPVYEAAKWRESSVRAALVNALVFLTGDDWRINFSRRKGVPVEKPQVNLPFPSETRSILAYSDGMDSRAVAGLADDSSPGRLLRVKVGSKAFAGDKHNGIPVPFTGIPYQLNFEGRTKESTSRSRGFKFAMFAGIAAYLTDAAEVVVPESGQGVFGPAMVPVMHGYADYRNHPGFASLVSHLLDRLLGHSVTFSFPRLWNTKAETLSAYAKLTGNSEWSQTRSCWQDSRWCSVNGERRQCGICAACMLRRMSVFAAGLAEPNTNFICEDLTARRLEDSLALGFKNCGEAFRSYAIAGVLQLDHFAELRNNRWAIKRQAALVADPLKAPIDEVEMNLGDLIGRHASEWRSFLKSQGAHSFLLHWARGAA